MTRLERYKQDLAKLEEKRSRLLRTMNLVKASALNDDIENVKKLIEESEKYEAKPIKQLLSREKLNQSGLIPAMIECHLAADFLAYLTYNIEDILKKNGLKYVNIIPELKEIRNKCNTFASRLCNCGEDLNDLLIENDTLISALHKKCCSYMEQRLKGQYEIKDPE